MPHLFTLQLNMQFLTLLPLHVLHHINVLYLFFFYHYRTSICILQIYYALCLIMRYI